MNGLPELGEFKVRPEQRLAIRLVQKFGLAPAVDIDDLAKRHADVEYDKIPCGADALLLYEDNRRSRPLIVVEQRQSKNRRRFTLAHELGHIIIPWHIGELAYNANLPRNILSIMQYDMIEAEANRFAAELLMPRDWLAATVDSDKVAASIQSVAEKAQVSIEAALHAVVPVLPSGHMIVGMDGDNVVKLSQRSPGTHAQVPRYGEMFDVGELGSEVKSIDVVDGYQCKYYCIRFYRQIEIPSVDLLRESSKTILRRVVDSVYESDSAEKEYKSISGITASVNSSQALKGRPAAELYAAMRQRFCRESSPAVLHEEFDKYLAARALELRSVSR